MIKSNMLTADRCSLLRGGAALFVLFLFSGCVALQPFPTAARSGDTLTLAVGSADNMTKANTTVDFYPGTDPDLVTPISVPIRAIVKVNPDKTSDAWLGNNTKSIPRRSSHGAWLSVIVVDLPAVPEGDGVIRVTTNGEVVYPRFAATANGTDMLVTILPGEGSSNPFTYSTIAGASEPGNLAALEPKRQAIIKPPVAPEGGAELVTYGAIEIDVTIPILALDGSPIVDEGFAVVLDDQPQGIDSQTSLLWKRSGNDFTIMLVSPVGMYGYQSRVSVVPLLPDYLYIINGTPFVTEARYYDLNGAPSSGPLPSVSVLN